MMLQLAPMDGERTAAPPPGLCRLCVWRSMPAFFPHMGSPAQKRRLH